MGFVMLLRVATFVGVRIILTSIAPEQETAQMLVILLQSPNKLCVSTPSGLTRRHLSGFRPGW